MPPVALRMFGPRAGSTIYGILFSAFGIASVGGGKMTQLLVSSLGWSTLFKVQAAMTLVATIIVTILQPIAGSGFSSV